MRVAANRQSEGQRAWAVGFAINGLLATTKLVAGVAGNSYALIADAVESLGDMLSSVLVWGGLVIGSRPADDDHPYGHGKAEPLAALAVALTLLLAAGVIAAESIRRMYRPHERPAAYTLFVLLGVTAIKEATYRYEHRVAKRIDSSVIAVDAWHHRSDAITSAAAAVGIFLTLIGGPRWITADEWAALLACAVIMINAWRFARRACAELMDTAPATAPTQEIERAAMETAGARAVEKILARKMGSTWYVDLHLEVDPNITVREAHAVAHEAKDAIRRRCPMVADVLVHVEPHGDSARAAVSESVRC